jgi:hypothetical protein
MKFLDPACGCGNFLIIAYRELRALEIEVLRELRPTGQLDALADLLSQINVDQFYGIEIGEFPARIAETALWMMDHIMNSRLSLEFGRTYVRIPLRRSPHIRHDDALEFEWSDLLPSAECSFVFGNPPFIGAKYQSEAQRTQVRRIAALGRAGGTLDYVAAWFITAGRYVRESDARIGFVATNSITQGEQVAQLWPLLFGRCQLEIAFAHRTFAWGSDARGRAHVHVVILGLTRARDVPADKRLFSYDDVNGEPHESLHRRLSPYLIDASNLADPHLVVSEVGRPLNGLPPLQSGSQPIDGGNYIFNAEQRAEFLEVEPGAARFMRPFIGAREYLEGTQRWILALQGVSPADLRSLPRVVDRMRAVREFRKKSKRASTLDIAELPQQYNVELIPTESFLVIPEVTSERRDYIPLAWLEPPIIPSNKIRILLSAQLWHFAILTSAMHMAWMKIIGGRLESRYQYGIGVVYNTFPLPPSGIEQLPSLEPLAQVVLDRRIAHPGSSLSDLYDPDVMPADLRRAHQTLDRAVDRLYRRTPFASDRERVEHLFGLYERMVAPMAALAKEKPKRRRRKS